MNSEAIIQISDRTLKGEISFPEVVAGLMEAGVEFYHVDYQALLKSFYGAGGELLRTAISYEDLPPVAESFSKGDLKAAILDSQLRQQSYRAFSERAMKAGVQGYFAFLKGQRVTYWGRLGDQHTEWFPGAGPKIME